MDELEQGYANSNNVLLSNAPFAAHTITFSDGSNPILTLNTLDGTVEFGDNATQNEAIRLFWQALARQSPFRKQMAEKCAEIAELRRKLAYYENGRY